MTTPTIGQSFNNAIPFYLFLTTAGDGTGAIDHTGNYSVTPREVYVQPAAGEALLITTLIMTIADDGTFDPQKYGAINALVNGFDFVVRANGISTGLLQGNKIKTGFDAMGCGAQFQFVEMLKDRPLLQVRFEQGVESAIRLNGNTLDRLSVTLNDNFTGMLLNRFSVAGVKT